MLKRPISVLAVLCGVGMLGAAFPGMGSESLAHAARTRAAIGSGAAANTIGTAGAPSNEDWG